MTEQPRNLLMRRPWRRSDEVSTQTRSEVSGAVAEGRARTRAAVIVNPYASGMTGKREREIITDLRKYADIELLRTERMGHASELAKMAALDGVDVIIACGGDGTGNEVLSGLVLEEGSADKLPVFALLPAGGTNVLCRSLDLPNHPVAAAKKLAPSLADLATHSRTINLGRVDERIFMFSAGIGFDGELVKRIDAKRRGRRPSDVSHVVTMVGMFASQRWALKDSMTITIPATGEELRASMLRVCNTAPMSYVGRIALDFMPDCSLEGGLDFLAPGRTTLFASLWDSMRAMRHVSATGEHSKLQPHHDLDGFKVVCDEAMPVQVDGEYLGDRTHIKFSIVRNCIKLMV